MRVNMIGRRAKALDRLLWAYNAVRYACDASDRKLARACQRRAIAAVVKG